MRLKSLSLLAVLSSLGAAVFADSPKSPAAFLECKDGSGDTIKDSCGNNNTGKIRTLVMIKKIKDIVIYGDPKFYSAFPAVQALPGGKVVAVFRRAPNYCGMPGIPEDYYRHGDILSQLMLTISNDNGETWGPPAPLYAPPEGCAQDGGLYYDGKYLFANSFIWSYVPDQVAEALKKSGQDEYLHKYMTYMLPGGSFVMRSADLGGTWAGPFKPAPLPHNIETIPGVKLTVHNRGNIVRVPGGPLVLAGQKLGFRPAFNSSIVLYKSDDDGKTWQYMVTAADCRGVSVLEEPRLHITPSGKWVVLIRCHNLNGEKFPRARMCVAESSDSGVTWSEPRLLNFHAEPATSLQMDDGRVIVAYGHREPPFGVKLRICDPELDNLESAEEHIIRGDAEKTDTGYPWITQTGKNKFLLVYYINKASCKGASQIEGTFFEIE